MSCVSALIQSPWACEPSHARNFLSSIDALERAMLAAGPMPKEDREQGSELYSVVDGVATITINGPMLSNPPAWLAKYGVNHANTESITAAVQTAGADTEVTEVVLSINSPGGMVTGTAELADAVYSLGKPTTARVGGMAASAAYWVASQADRVVANSPTSEIGSIGVYQVLADVSRAYAAEGIDLILVSSGGIKGHGADGRVTPGLVAASQDIIDGIFSLFKEAVVRGRGSKVAIDAVATGRTWLSGSAIFQGLIDPVESPSTHKDVDMNLNDIKALSDEFPAHAGEIINAASAGKTVDEIRAGIVKASTEKELFDLRAAADAAKADAVAALERMATAEAEHAAELAAVKAERDELAAKVAASASFAANAPRDPGAGVSQAGNATPVRSRMTLDEKAKFIKAHGKDAYLSLPE
jgi:ClpP class serine protease